MKVYLLQWDIVHINWDTHLQSERQPILMQFTGLLDRNGKEIYEGDIIELLVEHWDGSYPIVQEVVFKDGCFRPWGTGDWEQPSDDFEVIGNIYKNNELLEKK